MDKKPHIYSISNGSYILPTQHLTQKQVKALYHASVKAFEIGCPLNRFITIHYDEYADKKRPQKFVTKFLEHTRKWLQKRGLPIAYVYTLENGKNKGIHAHILLHIPNNFQRPYKKAMTRWLPFPIMIPYIAFRRIQYPHIGSLHPLNGMYGRLKYICKGLNPETPIFDIDCKKQGIIMGRRWGISKTLR